MLTISPLHMKLDEREQGEMEISSPFSVLRDHLDFPEFSAPVGYLLDNIDFDDLINDGDVLPDLEMDPEGFMAEFSVCTSFAGDLEEDSGGSTDMDNQVVPDCCIDGQKNENRSSLDSDGRDEYKVLVVEAFNVDEIESKKSTRKVREKSKKLASSKAKKSNHNVGNNNQGKRKTKVDWTPDLHRRFVQAVEQLGVEKAVPSRILELMGIDCLTRHNVASHLQKYRSHRKHLLAREAEAVSWTQKRQMYGIAVAPTGGGGGGGGKNRLNHQWHPPTIGFPPMTPPPIHHHNNFRPLHVWGHPTHHVEHQPMMSMWPKQLLPSPPLHPPPHPPSWAAPPPHIDRSFWHSHHQHTLAAAAPVPGIPPPHTAMYKPHHNAPSASQSAHNHQPVELHPTNERIDAVIGDVLSKPWLPLPIGLKPPSTDSVMVELQRQGIPKIPPSCSS